MPSAAGAAPADSKTAANARSRPTESGRRPGAWNGFTATSFIWEEPPPPASRNSEPTTSFQSAYPPRSREKNMRSHQPARPGWRVQLSRRAGAANAPAAATPAASPTTNVRRETNLETRLVIVKYSPSAGWNAALSPRRSLTFMPPARPAPWPLRFRRSGRHTVKIPGTKHSFDAPFVADFSGLSAEIPS